MIVKTQEEDDNNDDKQPRQQLSGSSSSSSSGGEETIIMSSTVTVSAAAATAIKTDTTPQYLVSSNPAHTTTTTTLVISGDNGTGKKRESSADTKISQAQPSSESAAVNGVTLLDQSMMIGSAINLGEGRIRISTITTTTAAAALEHEIPSPLADRAAAKTSTINGMPLINPSDKAATTVSLSVTNIDAIRGSDDCEPHANDHDDRMAAAASAALVKKGISCDRASYEVGGPKTQLQAPTATLLSTPSIAGHYSTSGSASSVDQNNNSGSAPNSYDTPRLPADQGALSQSRKLNGTIGIHPSATEEDKLRDCVQGGDATKSKSSAVAVFNNGDHVRSNNKSSNKTIEPRSVINGLLPKHCPEIISKSIGVQQELQKAPNNNNNNNGACVHNKEAISSATPAKVEDDVSVIEEVVAVQKTTSAIESEITAEITNVELIQFAQLERRIILGGSVDTEIAIKKNSELTSGNNNNNSDCHLSAAIDQRHQSERAIAITAAVKGSLVNDKSDTIRSTTSKTNKKIDQGLDKNQVSEKMDPITDSVTVEAEAAEVIVAQVIVTSGEKEGTANSMRASEEEEEEGLGFVSGDHVDLAASVVSGDQNSVALSEEGEEKSTAAELAAEEEEEIVPTSEPEQETEEIADIETEVTQEKGKRSLFLFSRLKIIII